MAYYLVGNNDGSFFKRRTTWELDEAIDRATDGDVIEIQWDYETNLNSVLKIDKMLTFIGLSKEIDGNVTLPVLPPLVISAKGVCLDNLSFLVSDTNALELIDGAVVTGQNSLVENVTITHNPTIFVGSEATLELKNSRVICLEGNALVAKEQAQVTLHHSYLKSGTNTYPCLVAFDSQMTLFGCHIEQEMTDTSAIWGVNSTFNMSGSIMSSLEVSASSIIVDGDIIIKEYLKLLEESKLIGQYVMFAGENEEVFDLFATEASVIHLKILGFGKAWHCNIRLNDNVAFEVETVSVFKYDEQEELLSRVTC